MKYPATLPWEIDKRNTELTPDEIEAAIYYLQNIKDIQAKAKAA